MVDYIKPNIFQEKYWMKKVYFSFSEQDMNIFHNSEGRKALALG